MAEIPKQFPWMTPVEEEMGFLQQDKEETRKKMQTPDGSVLLDVEGLLRLVDAGIGANEAPDDRAIGSPPALVMLQKTLTRKFSQRGERKAAAPDGDHLLPTTTAGGNRGSAAASPAAVAVVLSPTTAPEMTAAATSPRPATPCRRVHGRRAAASWLDPRRVLLFFATLSSMGTIILLYFTLSMGKMGDGDANAR